jgi:glycosyltransferase involved in cell wall biosynthesis
MTHHPRRLAFLITSLSWGGAQVQLVRLARELKLRGWDVRVVSMLEPGVFADELHQADIPVDSLFMSRGVPAPSGIFKLASILHRWNPTVLCSFMYHANLLGRAAGRLVGVPVIVSSIRNENLGNRMRERIDRLTNWASDAITTNSTLAAAGLTQRGVVAPGRLLVIPNSIQVDRYAKNPGIRPRQRLELGIGNDEFLWLSVGRLEQDKDHENLLAAMGLLDGKGIRASVRVAGEGPDRDRLEAAAAELNLQDRVKFLGTLRDLRPLYHAADGFVLPSRREGLPNVIMEALASGLPVVASRVGGVPELVHEGESGILVPPRDAEALAAAMRRLMDTPVARRREMGARGRRHVEENFGVGAVTDQWESLFQELARRKWRGAA